MEVAQPDEIYNLAAISFVALSWNQAELTANLTGTGVLRMLEAMRMVGGNTNNKMRFYQASSSEMFGKVRQIPQTELTPFHPRSPYGCAKVFGHDITVNFRHVHGPAAFNDLAASFDQYVDKVCLSCIPTPTFGFSPCFRRIVGDIFF
jgi:GDPmannose 4,6-dehydratase